MLGYPELGAPWRCAGRESTRSPAGSDQSRRLPQPARAGLQLSAPASRRHAWNIKINPHGGHNWITPSGETAAIKVFSGRHFDLAHHSDPDLNHKVSLSQSSFRIFQPAGTKLRVMAPQVWNRSSIPSSVSRSPL